MLRPFLRGDLHPRVAKRRKVERLADAVLRKQLAREQLRGTHVGHDLPLAHEHDAVHAPPQHILQPVLDDDHRGAAALLDLVDELNGLLAGGRVEVGQRLLA